MYRYFVVCIFFVFFSSCTSDQSVEADAKFLANQKKIFNTINNLWQFRVPMLSPTVSAKVVNWYQWQQFTSEINQKPKNNITAFQLKTKNLVRKCDSLIKGIPAEYNKPQVLSRIATLNTKMKTLHTYIKLPLIPEQKIKPLFSEINEEIQGLVTQWEEIEQKKLIPKEIGEDEMIHALDTTRNANAKQMFDKMNEEDSPDENLKNLPKPPTSERSKIIVKPNLSKLKKKE